VIFVCCVFVSASLSGLTLGIMSLDTTQMQLFVDVAKENPDDKEAQKNAKFAKALLPIRKYVVVRDKR
jgi:hypothetical protein